MSSSSDEFETVGDDLKIMLDNIACKQCDQIWEPFCAASGYSVDKIAEFGFSCVGTNSDFFETDAPPGTTVICSNPPFSCKQKVLRKLLGEHRLPFALLLPSIVLQRDFFSSMLQEFGSDWHFSALLPNKSLRFHRNGEIQYTPPFKSMFLFAVPRSAVRCQHLSNESWREHRLPIRLDLYDYQTDIRDKQPAGNFGI